jgi:hypothetical protein
MMTKDTDPNVMTDMLANSSTYITSYCSYSINGSLCSRPPDMSCEGCSEKMKYDAVYTSPYEIIKLLKELHEDIKEIKQRLDDDGQNNEHLIKKL